MSRPRKFRTVCCCSVPRRFESDGGAPPVEVALDELEAVRLTDLEKLDQQPAADRMGVSRGTLQRLLYAARRKVAFALVGGRSIVLAESGRETRGCSGDSRCRFCRREMELNLKKEEPISKVFAER